MSPIIRIFLRYLAGFLIAKGWTDAATADVLATDPDLIAGIEAVVGIVIAGVSEWWYARAVKTGGKT